MSREPLPEPWRSALEPKGISSRRGLASKAGISPQTAKRLIDQDGSPSHETVAAIADALFNGDRARVWDLAGITREDHGDWTIPSSLTSQLDPEQRKAVLAVVRAMLPPDARRGDGDAERRAAPIGARDEEVPTAKVVEIFTRLNTRRNSLTREEINRAMEKVTDSDVDDLVEDISARKNTD